jgi:hypothetical protein
LGATPAGGKSLTTIITAFSSLAYRAASRNQRRMTSSLRKRSVQKGDHDEK